MSTSADLPASGSLRQRQQKPADSAATVADDQEGHHHEDGGEGDVPIDRQGPADTEPQSRDPKPKTIGRTPDGVDFTVPTTHDMVSQLLDPRQPKNLSDAIVLAILALHILLAYLLPAHLKRPVFAAIFLFWRASYNIGIGLLLRIQSNHRRLVTWTRRWRLFEKPAADDTDGKTIAQGQQGNPRPWLYRLLKRELEAKIPEDYNFDDAPIEYNTWLVFRRVVDLILMCDFVSYCLFAIVCAHKPEDEGMLVAIGRWGLGVALFAFNLWVKLDAHRVVKDYAWYWGDFFFLVDQDLTFDGVFEMAPHPMYSIGYAGYYGISMMAASYEVLFISIAAHLAQFAFLALVENPHIEKTYNPPPPRRRRPARSESDPISVASASSEDLATDLLAPAATTPESPSAIHNLLGLKNLDLFRVTDYTVLLLVFYLAVLTVVTPSTRLWQALFVGHAIVWRLWYTLGLGMILAEQSKNKMWTRHFLKFGDSTGEAWRQWKGMYHLSMTLCYASFIAACWKMYSPPEDWSYGWVLLKHVVGASLVALQVWTATSVYESLGEFGWFFGDFFFDHAAKLTYKSIYRFLNNPERVFGSAGLWGAALITWSRAVFVAALMSQLLTLWFIAYVEKPHMQKVYGQNNIRREAGLTKFLKRSLPPPVRDWQESVDKALDESSHVLDDFLEAARTKFAAGVKTIGRDTTALFQTYPARLTITRLNPDLAGYDPKHYALSVEGTRSAQSAISERATGKESVTARFPQAMLSGKTTATMILEYGSPIRVRYTAPANHSRKDWIGLYMVTDNRSREVTEVPSLGRWVPTSRGTYDAATYDCDILVADRPIDRADPSDPDMVEGEVLFHGDKLWWTQGVFEFRYHHAGNHNVMALSQPFEIRIGKFDDIANADDEDSFDGVAAKGPAGPLYEKAIEAALLPVVRNCLDQDPDIAPNTPDEPFGGHVERDSKYAKRVVYAIHQMFGVEFAPAVVPADGNVRKLAWRICNAKQVLAPYSMSHSNGATTPSTESYAEI